MSFNRPWITHITLVLLAFTLAACGQPTTAPGASGEPPAGVDMTSSITETAATTESAAPAAASTLRVALDVPAQLDPAFASSDAEIAVLNAVYDYLVDIDAENQIQPRLAREWSTSEDGLTWTFTLNEGVTFHDGQPLSATDVVWTFDRLRDPAAELPTADLYANIAAVEPVDDSTVTFTLTEPNPFFLYDLSDNHALILKAETPDPKTVFNGTGPFKVEDYQPENRMTLVANPDYFNPDQPGVDRLELIFFQEQSAAVDALRGGQVDLVTRMPTSLFQSLESEPEIQTVAVPTNGFDLVRLRADRPPGNDPVVIKALRLATDREAILQTVTQGLGAIGRDSPIGPIYQDYYSEDTPLPELNVEAASKLLTDAGYTSGIKLDLHVPDTGDRPDLAVMLKEQWQKIGVDVNVIVEPESVYYGEQDGWLDVDLGITGWGSRPVPQFYLDVMLKCDAKWNESHYCDPELDRLAEVAGSTADEAERIKAYQQIQRILIERGPAIIPYFFAQLGAIRTGWDGFALKPFAGRTDLAAIRPQ
jgi:peptide/nickel transport system substrate-binding protein